MKYPNSIKVNGRSMNFTGKGRAVGSVCYVDVQTFQTVELFEVEVTSTGRYYSLGRVDGNATLANVRIDNGALQFGLVLEVGDLVLAGPISFPEGRPKAEAAIRLRAGHSPFSVGTVFETAPDAKWGRIIEDYSGRRLFLHHSQLRQASEVKPGLRLSYRAVQDERGWQAISARLIQPQDNRGAG